MQTLIAAITAAAVWAFLMAHQVIIYHFICVGIDQLPAPGTNSSTFYRWLFGVLQYMAANYNRGTRGVQGRLGQ